MLTSYSRFQEKKRYSHEQTGRGIVYLWIDRFVMEFQYSCGSSSEGDRFSSLAGYRCDLGLTFINGVTFRIMSSFVPHDVLLTSELR